MISKHLVKIPSEKLPSLVPTDVAGFPGGIHNVTMSAIQGIHTNTTQSTFESLRMSIFEGTIKIQIMLETVGHNFGWQNISADKIFGGQYFSADKILGMKPKFRQRCSPNFCPIK